jgi:Fe-S-cluster containining protein
MRKTAGDRKCVFLEDKLCRIYSIRPLVCRFYPFELRIVGNSRHWFAYTEECPGTGKGEKLTRKYYENLYRQLTKPTESARQVRDEDQ